LSGWAQTYRYVAAGRRAQRADRDRTSAKRRRQTLREQLINFLEAALVVSMLTNAFAIAAAAYAISLAQGIMRAESRPATEHRALAFLARWLRMRA
jgi:hypothetical protein